MSALPELADHANDVHPAPRAEDAIYPWHRLRDLSAVALREATGCDQDLTVALLSRKCAQRLYRFVLGRANEAASVDDQNVRLRRVLH